MQTGEGTAPRAPALAAALLVLLALAAAPAGAEFQPFNAAPAAAPETDFCAPGKFLIFAGSCSPVGKRKDVISPKSCGDAAQTLYDGLSYLYPNAAVEFHQDLAPEEVVRKLMRPMILGFFFVGEGDAKGGFVTGPERQRLYPDLSVCQLGKFDLFAAFTSHSKYSPDAPARKADTAMVISRSELLYGGAGAAPGSWARLCRPGLSLVYPTRTFAGRIKDDLKKLLGALQDQKKKHVLKTLGTICDGCQGLVASGNSLAQFCPPNSNICKQRKITPGTEEFILKNYCAALGPLTRDK